MGEEGHGWRIAMQTLQYERGAEAGAAGGISILATVMDDLLRIAEDVQRDGQPLMRDPVTGTIWSNFSSKSRPCIWQNHG